MKPDEKVSKIIEKLKGVYPEPKLALHYSNPFQLLVAVILSAQCTDERVNQVTRELFRKVKNPQDLINIPLEELEELIKPTGYYRQKAKNLKACCERLAEEYGNAIPKSIEHLTKLPGVGRKTAAMVLGNAFGINEGIAVDTHVKRLSQRLGLSTSKTPEKIEKELMQMVPQDLWTWLSNAMILHGRHICRARNPRCSQCPLTDYCDYFLNK